MNPLEARRRLLGRNVYKRTTEGNPAIAQGSLARRYPGITMQGWTEQAQYEGKNLLDISKLMVDYGYTMEGVLTPHQGRSSIEKIPLTAGQYIFSNHPYAIIVCSFDSSDTLLSRQSGIGDVFTVPEGASYIGVTFYADSAIEPSQLKKTMLNEGSTALPYEPYTGGKPSPNPEYPQEIVSAGKYNEDAQKWEYEITIANEQTDPEKNQTVTLTADRPLTKWDKLEKRNGQWEWVYKSMETTLDGSEKWGVYAGYEGFSVAYILDTPRVRAEGFCESFICEQYNVGKDTALWLGVNNYSVYAIRIPQYNEELPDSGLQDWKDWLSENPITILTYADEETFVPLSETEQEAMNELYTFRPTTVLSNDEGCEMSLTYKTKRVWR